ncbi:hypothetical protein NFI96_023077, partial [Prochilodus magdalenae]
NEEGSFPLVSHRILKRFMGRVVSYPEDCAVEYDYTTCTFKVVKKNDHKEPCPHVAVGK